MRTWVLVVAAVLLAACSKGDDDGSADAFAVDAEPICVDARITNESTRTFVEAYFAEASDPSWGTNVLVFDLNPGDRFYARGTCCGELYDFLLIDETGFECEVFGVDLCEDWSITDGVVAACGG